MHGIQLVGDGFAVMAAILVSNSQHFVVYSSVIFSGDSGGAVVFSENGGAFALHLESVNQAKEELEHGTRFTLEDVADSVNQVTRGLTQGYLGLRLDSDQIQAMLV